MEEFDVSEKIEQIIDLIGEENTIKMCRTFAGESVYFPKSILIHLEHREIRKEYQKGADYRALSIKYDRTTRQIRDIIHSDKYNKDSSRQFDLF